MLRRWLSNYFANNKKKNLFIFIIIIFIIIFIAASKMDSELKANSNESKEVYRPQETVISGNDISKEKYENDSALIKTFINYCNNGELEEAYNLLSTDCKEKVYSTKAEFKKNYVDVIFTEDRECNLQSWINSTGYNTYKAIFIEDIISTGNYDNVKEFVDYITVCSENDSKKINVNNYIKTIEVNKETKKNELTIKVKSIDVYMEYVECNIVVESNNDKKILLDNLEYTNTTRLIGSDNIEYKLDKSTIFATDLLINENSVNDIKLKFFKQYSPDKVMDSIKFKKVILDYDSYIKNKEEYDNYKEISIKL